MREKHEMIDKSFLYCLVKTNLRGYYNKRYRENIYFMLRSLRDLKVF